MKYLIALLSPFLALSLRAQLFYEPFIYPENLDLSSVGWQEHSRAGTNTIKEGAAIDFDGFTRIGTASLLSNGQDIHQQFASQGEGNVYASVLVNVQQAESAGDYFFHLGEERLGTQFRVRLSVRAAEGGIQFGISKSSNNVTYDKRIFRLNKTYQLVLKYTFIAGATTNDELALFILEASKNKEPVAGIKAIAGEDDAFRLGIVALRQGSSGKAANLRVGMIKIANSWAEATSLKPEIFATMKLPERIYNYQGLCENRGIFSGKFYGNMLGSVLEIKATNGQSIQFSKDGKDWKESLNYANSSGRYFEDFFFRIGDNIDLREKEIYISAKNKNGTVLSRNLFIDYIPLRLDCTVPIQYLSQLLENEMVSVAGRISASAHEFAEFNYLQDNTGGLRIEGDFGFHVGDSVRFEGLISTLNNEKVLIADKPKFQVFDNKKIKPKRIGFAEIQEHAGQLVEIENLKLADPRFVFLPNANEAMTQNGRKLPVRIWSKTGIAGHTKPQGDFTIRGVVGQFRKEMQLYPRGLDDVQNIGEIPATSDLKDAENTFELATWNMEWFGSEGFGPENEELQFSNALQVIQGLNADLYVLEEVCSLDYFNSLVGFMKGYSGACSAAVSGKGKYSDPQRVCFVYRDDVVNPISLAPLLLNTPEIADYPNGFDQFWSNGRLPALFKCEVNLAGKTQVLNVVGIHARANRSNSSQKEIIYEMRKRDVAVLKDSLDTYFFNEPVIIAGDYNDDVDETVVSGLVSSTYAPFVDDYQNWKVLSKTLSDKGHKSYIGYDNVIDHIMVSNELFNAAKNQTLALQLAFLGIDDYPETTSDHLPLLSSFDFRKMESVKLDSEEILIFPNADNPNFSFHLPRGIQARVKLLEENSLCVFDLTGEKEELTQKFNNVLSLVPSGNYFIQVFIGNTANSYKIVKTNR